MLIHIFQSAFIFYKKEFLSLKGSLFFGACLSSVLFLDAFFSFCVHVLYGTTDLVMFFSNMLFVVMVVSSIVGGKLVSQEKQNGTLSLLLTKPVSLKYFVIGKFLFITLFWFIIFFCSFLWNYFLSSPSGISWKFLAISYFGFFLLVLYFQSISFVISSFFDGQFSSVMGSIITFFFLYLLSFLDSQSFNILGNLCKEISFVTHWETFQRGFFDLGSFFYFLFWISFSLVLSSKLLQVRC